MLITKYKELSNATKATIWFMICSIFQKGISVITVPIFTRLLTTEEYGIFNVYQSWSGIIGVFATLNLSYGVFNNGMTKYKERQIEYTASMQGLSTCITVGLFLLYWCLKNRVNELIGLSTNYIVLMFISFIVSPALGFWSTRQRYNFKYKALVIVTLSSSILTPLAGIIAINLTEYKIEARIYTSVLIGVFISCVIYIYTFVKGKIFYNKKFWVFAIKFNIPLIPHYLSQTVLNQADKIMIEKFCGLNETGIYSIAYSISMLMNIVTNSINSSYVPWTYRVIKKKEYNKLKKTSNILLIVVFLMTVLSILLAPEIIYIMAPEEYYEAIWIIPPIASSVYFIFLYSLFGNVEFYFAKTKYVMYASIIGSSLNVILNYILIPIYGYLVAGYTTMICYLIFSIMHGLFMRKVLREENVKENLYDMKFFTKSVFLMLVSVIISVFLYKWTILRYGVIVLLILTIFCFKNKFTNILKEIKSDDM